MWTNTRFLAAGSTALVTTGLALYACGGNPVAPSGGGGGGAGGGNVPTITITNTGVTPNIVSVGMGGRVRFTNNSSSNRQINSDPFPAHNGCPPINDVSLLTPGQSKETGSLTLSGACGFHDHLTEGDSAFSGRILVATEDPGAPPPTGYY
jgi:hypothetical protein